MSGIPGSKRVNRGRCAGRTPRVALNDGQISTKPHKTAPRLRAEVRGGRKLLTIPLARFSRFRHNEFHNDDHTGLEKPIRQRLVHGIATTPVGSATLLVSFGPDSKEIEWAGVLHAGDEEQANLLGPTDTRSGTLQEMMPDDADKAIRALTLEHKLVTLTSVDKAPSRPDREPQHLPAQLRSSVRTQVVSQQPSPIQSSFRGQPPPPISR